MLRRLISDLRCTGPLRRTQREMANILREVCFAGVPLESPLPSRERYYTRTCAYRTDDFEVLLLNWSPGAVSPIHDHGGEHCWLAVLDGSLVVDDYGRLDSGERMGRAVIEPRGTAVLECGDVDLRSGLFDIHRVGAAGSAGAVSLHVYARPLQRYLVYDEFEQRCSVATGKYDASM